MIRDPAVTADVTRVAVPFTNVALPNGLPLSVKVTVPPGTPVYPLTTATTLTGTPACSAERLNDVVVTELKLTLTAIVVLLRNRLAAELLDEYCAVTVCVPVVRNVHCRLALLLL